MYKLIRSLVVPQKPSKVEYKALLDKFKKHFAPTPSCIVETLQVQFLSSRTWWISSILCSTATFNVNSLWVWWHARGHASRQNHLWDSRRPHSMQVISRAKANICQSGGTEKDSKTILPWRDTASVNLTWTMCYHCGKEHSPDTCKFKESLCQKCSKKGHIAKVCRSGQSDSKWQRNSNGRSNAQAHGINQVKPTKPRSEQQDLVYNLFNFNNNQQSTKPVQVTGVVNGQSLLILVLPSL